MAEPTNDNAHDDNDDKTAGNGWVVVALDGATHKMRPTAAQAVADALASRDAEIARLRDDVAAAKGRGDAAEQAVRDAAEKHQKALDAARAEAEARAGRIATLRAEHRELTGSEPQQDASDVDMQRAVIAHLSPGFALDGREPVAIASIYQFVVEQARAAAVGDAKLRSALDHIPGDAKTDTTEAAAMGLYDAARKPRA